jgi:hypothetical protein
MLVSHADGLWSAWQDHTMLGMHIGSRMSIVRLADDSLLLHSPIGLRPELRKEIDALGEVRHIVCPNLFHHVYAKPWIEAYPKAEVHAPAEMRKKRPDLRIDAELGKPHADWKSSLIPIHIDGCQLDETVFVHPASRTIVSVDLVENFKTHDHWPTRMYLKASGVYGQVGWSRLLRWLYRDHGAARRSVDLLLDHDVDRIILAHGDVIESGAKDALHQTFQFLKA